MDDRIKIEMEDLTRKFNALFRDRMTLYNMLTDEQKNFYNSVKEDVYANGMVRSQTGMVQ